MPFRLTTPPTPFESCRRRTWNSDRCPSTVKGENRERLGPGGVAGRFVTLRIEAHGSHVATSGYLEGLYRLVEEELTIRFERYIETRTRLANFPFRKTLAQFDCDAQPSLDKRAIMELSSMSFVERATNVILLGPPGVGKTQSGSHLFSS
jgi:DNA replication protein DnaC